MNSHNLLLRNRLDPQRVRISQVILARKGKLLKILLGAYPGNSSLTVYLTIKAAGLQKTLNLRINLL